MLSFSAAFIKKVNLLYMFIIEDFLKICKSPPLMFSVPKSLSKGQPGTAGSVFPLLLFSGDFSISH